MAWINSQTPLYGVIGNPIGHSLSPVIHNRIYELMDLHRVYHAFQVLPEELETAVGFFRRNLKGFNVTIPHKEAILPFLDEIDSFALACGAVNTVKWEEGRLVGYNTDGYGFTKALEVNGLSLAQKRVLVVGAGGAARVVVYELLRQGCQVTVANRNPEKSQALADDLAGYTGTSSLEAVGLADLAGSYGGIVNTTPLGMAGHEGALPVSEELIRGAEILYDLVYQPPRTPFLKAGEKYGINVLNGLPMLFYQGIKAQEIWLGESIQPAVTAAVYRDLCRAAEKAGKVAKIEEKDRRQIGERA